MAGTPLRGARALNVIICREIGVIMENKKWVEVDGKLYRPRTMIYKSLILIYVFVLFFISIFNLSKESDIWENALHGVILILLMLDFTYDLFAYGRMGAPIVQLSTNEIVVGHIKGINLKRFHIARIDDVFVGERKGVSFLCIVDTGTSKVIKFPKRYGRYPIEFVRRNLCKVYSLE